VRALQQAQVALHENKKIPVVVLVSGQDGAGKGETINLLYEWMDPRFLTTLAFSTPVTKSGNARPCGATGAACRPRGAWAFLPVRGIRTRSASAFWTKSPLKELDAQADQINRFEAMLVNEGALVLKFWFHLTQEGQIKRLKALEKDPRTAWRVTQWNWDRLKTYDKLQDAAGHLLRMTNTPWAPWVVIEARRPLPQPDRGANCAAGLAKEGGQHTPGQPRWRPWCGWIPTTAPCCRRWT
jgi:hypothetical protein